MSSFFEDFGFELDPNRFDALLEQRAGANSANDSKPTSEGPTLSNIQVVATSQVKSDNVCKIPAKHRMTDDTKTGVSGSAGHKAITKDKLGQSNTQKKHNFKAIADAVRVSVTALKKKLRAERAAKALAGQKEKERQERQDRKLKIK
jgi:hypothetical protein